MSNLNFKTKYRINDSNDEIAIQKQKRPASKNTTKFNARQKEDEKDRNTLTQGEIKKIVKEHRPVDIQTVCDELINANSIDLAGGADYLFELANNFVGYENAKHCINLVYNQAVLRKYLKAINKIQDTYYNSEIDSISDFLTNSEKQLQEVAKRRSIEAFKDAKMITDSLQNRLETMKKADEENNIGVTTGYRALNDLIHGFQPGQFVILAARPAVGKTAFGLNLCYNAAIKGYPVAYFSLEMSAESLMTRIVSTESKVSQDCINLGRTTTQQRLAVKQACDRIGQLPLYIDDTAGITAMEMRSRARRLKADKGLDLIVVDYLQLMQGSGKHNSFGDRQQEVSEISRSLKALARELNVPIISLSQLSRGVEARQIKRPMLSDLRESGSLEQDADIVAFLYREDYYNPETENKHTELIIAKHRNGPVDTVNLFFHKQFTKFVGFTKMQE